MSSTQPITDEMPDAWVRDLADRIETGGHDIPDAHETAVVIRLTPASRSVLAADDTDRLLVISWSERAGADWGLSHDGAHVPDPQPLGGTTPAGIAARVHHLLATGRPESRDLRHAIPYTAPCGGCRCEQVRLCGGLIPTPDCPEHGDRRNPAMEWHWENACVQVAGR